VVTLKLVHINFFYRGWVTTEVVVEYRSYEFASSICLLFAVDLFHHF
jgi:hypothetical protein